MNQACSESTVRGLQISYDFLLMIPHMSRFGQPEMSRGSGVWLEAPKKHPSYTVTYRTKVCLDMFACRGMEDLAHILHGVQQLDGEAE